MTQANRVAIAAGEPSALTRDKQGITVRILADTLWTQPGYPQSCGMGGPENVYTPDQLRGSLAGVGEDGQWVHGYRLTTFECEYPLMIHNEVLTHRALSRCSASSRAIPTELQVERVRSSPFVPRNMTARKSGMQGGDLDTRAQTEAQASWLDAAINAAGSAEWMAKGVGVHKQHATRLLAPFMYIRTVITATDWANFYALRCSSFAQPEFHVLASLMFLAHRESMPRLVHNTDLHTHHAWHLPYVSLAERVALITEGYNPVEMSVARCARVSYDTRVTKHPEKDHALYSDLLKHNHASPFEHAAHPQIGHHGNFNGWRAHRALTEKCYNPGQVFPDDDDITLAIIESD